MSLAETRNGAAAGRGGDELVDAVLGASRALVAVAARSLATVAEDVTLAQYRVLIELAARGPQRLADLATALGVDRSTATRMCDRLVRKRLVHRRRTNQDRRGVRVSLTAAGGELVAEVSRRRRAEIADDRGADPQRAPAAGAECVCGRSLRQPARSPSRTGRWDGICDR